MTQASAGRFSLLLATLGHTAVCRATATTVSSIQPNAAEQGFTPTRVWFLELTALYRGVGHCICHVSPASIFAEEHLIFRKLEVEALREHLLL